MTFEEADLLCRKRGSTLTQYQVGCVATIVLPSGETLIVSIAGESVKVFQKRPITRWLLPKVLVEKRITDWIPEYRNESVASKTIGAALVLDGLLSFIACTKCAAEVYAGWTVIKNPVELAFTVVARELKEQKESL